MNAMDTIRMALQVGDHAMMMLLEDMKDAALTQPTPRGGNHPLWVLGHITFIEANLRHVLFGEPNPVAHWAPIFAPGSEPKTDARTYPAFDEVLKTYREHRTANLKLLEQVGEDDLEKPTTSPPKGLEDALRTTGQAFLMVALHQMSHRGQLADARRALGKKPVFTPGA